VGKRLWGGSYGSISSHCDPITQTCNAPQLATSICLDALASGDCLGDPRPTTLEPVSSGSMNIPNTPDRHAHPVQIRRRTEKRVSFCHRHASNTHLRVEVDAAVAGQAAAVVEEGPQLLQAVDAARLQILDGARDTSSMDYISVGQ
jgi:hypothetical protein